MIKIPLGRDNLFLKLDDEDADLAAISWYAHKSRSGEYYAAHREGSGARERVWAHELVMEQVVLRELAADELVDHINRDKLDCRRDNLRIATKSQNAINKTKDRRIATSRYKGVSKARNKWKASIQVNKKTIYIGTFDTERAAAILYNDAAREHFGEYAVLNDVVNCADCGEDKDETPIYWMGTSARCSECHSKRMNDGNES